MKEKRGNSSQKSGLPPGTLMHVGEKRGTKSEIDLINYTKDTLDLKRIEKIEDCNNYINASSLTWINVCGLEDLEIIKEFGKNFAIHPLVLEDIVNTNQRPKIEEFEDYIFVVLKMISYKEEKGKIDIEQISLIINSNFVISFQEKRGDIFDPLRERIKGGKGIIRKMGADYLTYALLDTIIDNYFIVLEKIGDKLEDLEDELISYPTSEKLQNIHSLKRDMIYLRKSVWPLREIVSKLERSDSKLIQASSHLYFRDIYDHTVQVIDAIETSRERLSSMLDIYLSSMSNRMNDVMKVLTIIATIFIPLTFIAGIYGMNFKYMPELSWEGSYYVVLLLMLVVAVGMIVYFKNKKWL